MRSAIYSAFLREISHTASDGERAGETVSSIPAGIISKLTPAERSISARLGLCEASMILIIIYRKRCYSAVFTYPWI